MPGGGAIVTLRDAIAYLAKSIPAAEHTMKPVQAAAHCVTEAAENGGPMIFARIGVMQAIHRHGPISLIEAVRSVVGKPEGHSSGLMSSGL